MLKFVKAHMKLRLGFLGQYRGAVLLLSMVLPLGGLPWMQAWGAHLMDREQAEYNQRLESRLIVNLFQDLMDKGDIAVYGQPLTAKDLTPVSVAHNYILARDELVVQIFSTLHKAIPIPHQRAMEVHALTIVLDVEGKLQSVLYHARSVSNVPDD